LEVILFAGQLSLIYWQTFSLCLFNRYDSSGVAWLGANYGYKHAIPTGLFRITNDSINSWL